MKNTSKGFAFLPVILIVAAVLAVGGGAYYYSENEDASEEAEIETETNVNAQTNTTVKKDTTSPAQNNNSVVSNTTLDWNVYTNTRYGIKFKYPKDFVIEKEGETNPGVTPHQIWIRLKRNNTGDTMDILITENKSVDVGAAQIVGKYGTYTTTKTTVGGKQAIVYKAVSEGGDATVVVLPLNGNEVQINFSSIKTQYWQDRITSFLSDEKETINKILSTFTFTAPISGNVTTQTAQATITSSSHTSVSGTAKNVTSLKVNVTAPFYGSIYGKTVVVVNGQWSLAIPNSVFAGTHGPYKVEVGPVNSSGTVNVLATANLTNDAFIATPMTGNAPLVVHFTIPPSAGDRTINYGDGTSCSTANPNNTSSCDLSIHVYAQPGTYTAVVNSHMPSTELGRLVITVK